MKNVKQASPEVVYVPEDPAVLIAEESRKAQYTGKRIMGIRLSDKPPTNQSRPAY